MMDHKHRNHDYRKALGCTASASTVFNCLIAFEEVICKKHWA